MLRVNQDVQFTPTAISHFKPVIVKTLFHRDSFSVCNTWLLIAAGHRVRFRFTRSQRSCSSCGPGF